MKQLNPFIKQSDIISIEGRDFQLREVSSWVLIEVFEFIAKSNYIELFKLLNLSSEEITIMINPSMLNNYIKTFLELNMADSSEKESIVEEGEKNLTVFEDIIKAICILSLNISSKINTYPERILKRYSLRQLKFISQALWPNLEKADKKGYSQTIDEFGIVEESWIEEVNLN